jgi:hypothetical protein
VSKTIDAFPAFAERVRARLEAGRVYEAAKPAAERPALDLVREIQEELEDVCGWSVALWARLEAIRTRAAMVDQEASNAERPARGSW